jgi:hypothetical protein
MQQRNEIEVDKFDRDNKLVARTSRDSRYFNTFLVRDVSILLDAIRLTLARVSEIRTYVSSKLFGQQSYMRFSRKFDLSFIRQAAVSMFRALSTVRIDTLYKRKVDKVRFVNSDQSDDAISRRNDNWKKEVLTREALLLKDSNRSYKNWLISKFFSIKRDSRLTKKRLDKMIVSAELTNQKKDLFIEMLYNRETALAWKFSKMRKVKSNVASSQQIKIIKHEVWQTLKFPILKALISTVTNMLKNRIKRETLESCHESYRNSWFLMKKKKSRKYRLINAIIEMNRVTVRDANLSSSIDEFSENFADCAVASLIDLFSEYDQVELNRQSRDLTAFMTSIELLRMTILSMRAINSVAQFVRIVMKILIDHIFDVARPFLDDIEVKGPKTKYDNEEVALGIRRYILEHIKSLDAVLVDLERASVTISTLKSHFCMIELKVVSFICDANDRHLDTIKVIKIIDWLECKNAIEARAFIDVCVYYRIWIELFVLIVAPIYKLLKKNVDFIWESEQIEFMNRLKQILISSLALIFIDYSPDAGLIILSVNASLKEWGGVLMQLIAGKRHSIRYESEIWSNAKAKYDATKRECREMLKTLKKIRFWLYEMHFVLKTNAEVLIAQLNEVATDLSSALLTRW